MDDLDDDRFAPLTESELAAVPAFDDAAKDEGECVMPVPAEAPPMPLVHPKWGKPSASWTYLDASGAPLFEVWRFDPAGERKKFLPLSFWRDASGRLAWHWTAVPQPRPLYGLDRLAASPGALVVVCEGEKSADAAAPIFPKSACITSAGGCGAWKHADWSPLAGRKVLIWPDADEPGAKYAGEVAAILHDQGSDVSIIDGVALASIDPDGGQREPVKGWDAVDAVREGQDLGALRKAVAGLAKPYEPGAPEPNGEDEFDAAIRRLADMSIGAYERVRAGEAKRLRVRAAVLDKLVAAERKEDCTVGQGKQLELPEPEPWPEPVDGAALIGGLEAAINRYVVLPKDAAFTCALWVLHAHCFDAFTCTPRLAITAPEKRCGKTTLLDVIGELVSRPLPTANITAAAVFRTIEVKRPVMLIDEADTFVGESEDLRGILNSGHRRGGQVIRTVGDDHDPRAFSTFCPVAIAQIGKLPSTLADRSIGVEMRRRTSSEKVMRFRNGRTQELGQLARMAARWVADNDGAIREREPDIPKSIFNRAADNWEPLLAIAEVAGARIAEHARQVALAACGGEDEQSLGVMLLTDIREAFGTKKEIASVALVAALVAMCDRPWGECNRGKALTQNWLARRLKPFGVHPKNVGPKRDQAKGYTLESFADAFKRYIPPDSTVHPYTANKNIDLDENQTVHQTNGWTDANADNQLNSNEVYGSTVENPPNGDSRECADDLPPGDHDWEDSL